MTARAAATAAGKRAKAGAAAAKHADPTRRAVPPSRPRRVSGPLHGRPEPSSDRPGPRVTARPVRSAGSVRSAGTARSATAARSAAATTARSAASATARAAFAATATAVAAAVEVAPRIVHPAPRPTRRVREVQRPAPGIVAPERWTEAVPATRPTRALAFVRGLPDHSVTDRLVRGRAWIPVLGVLLVGVVAMRVSLLQLNGSMGRAIEQGASLQTENGELRAQIAELVAAPRIERVAASMGMVTTSPQQITFLSPKGAGLRSKAIADLNASSSTTFAAEQGLAAADQSTTATTDASTLSTDTATSADTAGSTATPTTLAPAAPTTAADSTAAAAQPTGAASSGAAETSPAGTGTAGAGTSATAGVPTSGGGASAGG